MRAATLKQMLSRMIWMVGFHNYALCVAVVQYNLPTPLGVGAGDVCFPSTR